MATVAVRVDDELKEEATKLFHELGLDMTTAVKMFLIKSVKTKSIPFEVKDSGYVDSNNDYHLDRESIYIRTRDVTEYNKETQDSIADYMVKYKKDGIEPSGQSVEDFFGGVD